MPDNPIANGMPDMRPIYRLIDATRRLLRSSWVATGFGLTAGMLFATLVTVTLLDVAFPLGQILRFLGLVLIIVPAAWAFAVGVIVPLFRRLAPGHVARRIEAHLPGIHNRIVSCIDLATNKQRPVQSPAFYRRLVAEAMERIRSFRPATVIDFLSLRRSGLFAGISLVAFLIALATLSDRLPTAMARIFSPFADIPPATGVSYSVHPGDAKILRGEDIPFAVTVEKGEPTKLQLELRGEDGRTLWYDLQKQEAGSWAFTLNSGNIAPGFEHGFRYRIHGGGTWSQQYDVTLFDRPAIVSLHTVLHYPEYMGLPEPHVGPPQVADMTGPESGQVEVVVQTEGDVAEGEILLLKELAPTVRVPMQKVDASVWSGRFPLHGEGFYRVELRNELGHANKTMKEGKYVAIPDRPPLVVIERPGNDLVLSDPDKGEGFRQSLRHYDKPQRSESVVATLDLSAMNLKAGDQIRYRAEAKDRKGQSAQTQEFLIRIAADKSGADQQLATLEKTQDNFREKLIKLIADQGKVQAALEKLSAKYAPLNEKVMAALLERKQAADPTKAATQKPAEMDPESVKQLQALRQELTELSKQEQQNAQLGQQIAGELKNIADQSATMPLMPRQVAEQMQAVQQSFQQKAVDPLQDLASRMQQAQNPQQDLPNVNELHNKSSRVQKELEATRARLQALSAAEKRLRENAGQALDRLKREMLQQDAQMTARDLEALRDFIAARLQELKRLEGNQEQLMAANQSAADPQRPEVQKQQAKLEKEAEPPLADARDLLNAEKVKKMRRRPPTLPKAPYAPETDEEMVPPKEDDTDDPDSPKTKGKEGKNAAKPRAPDKEDE
jgi:hypothetical protein